MVAIITDAFKRQLIDQLTDDVDSTSVAYYLGIGRSQDWDSTDTPPNPTNSLREIRNYKLNQQAMKLGEDISFVIPRYNWTSGTTYSAYDDAVAGYPSNAYYVMTDELQVYICLQQGKNTSGIAVPSTIQPAGVLLNPQTTADGYVWRYLYSVSAGRSQKFQSANYQPVEFIKTTATGLTAQQTEQRTTQYSSIRGEITGIEMINGGTGYTSTPVVTITGRQATYDGVAPKIATATATMSAGAIVKIQMNDSSYLGVDGKAYGRGYQAAAVTITGGGGTGATARAVLAPGAGIGGDPRDDLRSTAIMFNSKFSGTEGNTFVTGNDFRQVAIIRNPRTGPDSDSPLFQGNAANTLSSLKFTSVGTSFTKDKTILGAVSGAVGLIDRTDSNRVYFHQDEATGFLAFTEGEAVNEIDGSGVGTLDSAGVDGNTRAYDSAEVDMMSGDILYIDNRAAVTRAGDQNEDVKVIIQL
jgi:hypothetical protein